MDSTAFEKFIWNFKQKCLTEDKIFILERTTKHFWFTLDQFNKIVECFSKSDGKKSAILLMAPKVAGIFTLPQCSLTLKQLAISTDRLQVLKELVPLIHANRDVYSVQQFIFSTFDSLECRREAFDILKEALKFELDYEDLDLNLSDESEVVTFEQIQQCAKNEKKRSVFELPFLSNLHVIKNMLMETDTKNQIEKEIARRIRENQHFFIPSKVSRILLNLNPDRKFSAKPFVMTPDSGQEISQKSSKNNLSTLEECGNENEEDEENGSTSIPNLHNQSSSGLDDSVSVSSSNSSSNAAKSTVSYPIPKNRLKSRSKNFFFNYFSVRRNSAASSR